MKVSEVMSTDVETVRPDQMAREAARFMLQADAGSIPVTDGDRLVGMITDRDITVRGVAQGYDPKVACVRDVMTAEVRYCYDDQDIDEVSAIMGDIQVRRLPVLNRSKRLVGIISLGDVALMQIDGRAAAALSGISRPGGQHVQI